MEQVGIEIGNGRDNTTYILVDLSIIGKISSSNKKILV